jgi:hypothetical protein
MLGTVGEEPEQPRQVPPGETQEERALRALRSIVEGADVTADSERLANEFTDRHTERLRGLIHGVLGRAARRRA